MPGGDRTGPMGMGPMTGRGAGYCGGAARPVLSAACVGLSLGKDEDAAVVDGAICSTPPACRAGCEAARPALRPRRCRRQRPRGSPSKIRWRRFSRNRRSEKATCGV